MKYIVKILVVAAALWVSTRVVDGITVGSESTAKEIGTLLAVALIFGVINALLKPIIKTIGCAFYVLTLGLFALVVNAGLLLLTSWIADQLTLPFEVAGFWAAFWGAIIIGVISWLLDLILGIDD
ncbi:phage holin family protein [Herbidospora sp. NEAU-GS84]|uniref:Phage holin family protein n=1 Tax=Herbidospora solisilvae TaxID=2696284 RepID=A0A7C9J604_9ACTN|nr:phage holin family protein [Herbidospora solisilvae]NAS24760.1 phage holin family protein [Herbidospora solisilvae]